MYNAINVTSQFGNKHSVAICNTKYMYYFEWNG